MNTTRAMLAIERARRHASFDEVFKSAAGTGFASLALFGVIASPLGHVPSLATGSLVALGGAVIGALLVIKG